MSKDEKLKDEKLKPDIANREDIQQLIDYFYADMTKDPIVGYIFTDIAKIELAKHLPIIVNFWEDILFKTNHYHGNTLRKHLELNQLIKLKPGHFTRWLFLFSKSVDQLFDGPNASLMKSRADMLAKSISAAIANSKKNDMQLSLSDTSPKRR